MARQVGQEQGSAHWLVRTLTTGGAVATVTALALTALPATGAAAASGGPASVGSTAAAAAAGGTLLTWGVNDHGQLGPGVADAQSLTPVQVRLATGTRIVSARAGCGWSLALTGSGKVLAWGDNSAGQLGNGTTSNSANPVHVKIPRGMKVTAVRAGCGFGLARTASGAVLAWGSNFTGQLGDGSTRQRNTPVRVKLPKGTKVTAISAGDQSAVALTNAGQVLAWGDNRFGELGDGSFRTANHPVRVGLPRGTKVTAMAAGAAHVLALTSTGKMLAWGINVSGQLGSGTTGSPHNLPVQVKLPPGTRARGLSAGCDQSLVQTRAGRVLAWGQNNFGQVGNGSTAGVIDTPVTVHLPHGAVATAVAAACTNSLALLKDGEVLAWGEETAGRLGDGMMFGSSNVPVQVQIPAGQRATAIGAGPDAENSFAITRPAAP